MNSSVFCQDMLQLEYIPCRKVEAGRDCMEVLVLRTRNSRSECLIGNAECSLGPVRSTYIFFVRAYVDRWTVYVDGLLARFEHLLWACRQVRRGVANRLDRRWILELSQNELRLSLDIVGRKVL